MMSDSSPIPVDSASEVVDVGFCERFGEMLSKLNLSQNEFARQLGSTSAFVSNIARGKSKPGLEFLQRIAETFEVSLDWLVLGKGTQAGHQGLNAEWHYAVMLRVSLAQLMVEGNTEADALAKELLGQVTTSKKKPSGTRESLLRELAARTSNANLMATIYNQMLGERDQSRRNAEALTAAINHLQRHNADPLAAMLNEKEAAGQTPAQSSHVQIQTGSKSKMAGRNFIER